MQTQSTPRYPTSQVGYPIADPSPSLRLSSSTCLAVARMRRACGSLAAARSALAVASRSLRAQQQPTFRSGTQIVLAVRRRSPTRSSGSCPTSTQDDFEVFDNDKPQPLVFFENETQPITVVVMLDTSGSMTGNDLRCCEQAAEQFLIRLLPDDKAKVGAFNDKIEISARFTNNRDELDRRRQGPRLRQRHAALGRDRRRASTSSKGIDGRRVILVFTDGDDTASRVGLRHGDRSRARGRSDGLRDRARERILQRRARWSAAKPDGGLRKLADETGGGYFELKKTADLGADLHARRAGAAQPVRAGLHADRSSTARSHKLAVRMKTAGHDRAGAPQLSQSGQPLRTVSELTRRCQRRPATVENDHHEPIVCSETGHSGRSKETHPSRNA